MNLTEQQYTLLAKHLSGESTPAEEQALAQWLAEGEENVLILKQMQAVWAATEPANVFSPAADKAWEKVSARLHLYPETVSKTVTPEAKVVPLFSARNLMRVAAVLLPLLVFGYLLRSVWFAYPAETVLSAGNQKQDFYLPDSTHIWLKPNTTLTYTSEYNEELREVRLTGEAFFEVKKNPGKPFVVQAHHTEVTVLGTSFLVKTTQLVAADEVEEELGAGRSYQQHRAPARLDPQAH